jgi:hypothetical protein
VQATVLKILELRSSRIARWLEELASFSVRAVHCSNEVGTLALGILPDIVIALA